MNNENLLTPLQIDLESIFRLNEELLPQAAAPTISSGRPQRKSTLATTALAASRKTGIAPQPVKSVAEKTVTGSSRRNPARQSHVITPGGNVEPVNGTLHHGRRDASNDQSKERRTLVNRSNGVGTNGSSREVNPKSPRPSKGTVLQASRIYEGRRSPRRMSPEPAAKSSKGDSLMPPPKPVIRRRSPRRSPETKTSEASQVKGRPSTRSPVAETVSKASTSAAAASTKRRSGVVKEVEKMQVIGMIGFQV